MNQQQENENKEYRQAQFDKLSTDSFNPPAMKITSDGGETHYMHITPEELEAIKNILIKNTMKKEIIYTMPNETDEQREDIQSVRNYLQNHYDDVQVYSTPYNTRIVATTEISQSEYANITAY